ncbi:hypothetical protein EVAR_4773_1 [Eumeta japonica]|uniref:Uncharacterized protein n=1 Tax=Eumeta variegata TaxID=151549 RepID=A0A4C1T1H7_EUMVA|nr:hypothetical protein EVAR_4773_1 [Eumeta japonica]
MDMVPQGGVCTNHLGRCFQRSIALPRSAAGQGRGGAGAGSSYFVFAYKFERQGQGVGASDSAIARSSERAPRYLLDII